MASIYFSIGPPAASLAVTPKIRARFLSATTRLLATSHVHVAISLATRMDWRRRFASRRQMSLFFGDSETRLGLDRPRRDWSGFLRTGGPVDEYSLRAGIAGEVWSVGGGDGNSRRG